MRIKQLGELQELTIGTERIKEHKHTETHMVSMVRWSNLRQRPLEEAFRRADIEDRAKKEEEQQ